MQLIVVTLTEASLKNSYKASHKTDEHVFFYSESLTILPIVSETVERLLSKSFTETLALP